MSSRNSDVSLVIRARDEAQKTINGVEGALQRLVGAQNKVAGSATATGSGISELASIIAALDKAYVNLTGNATNAEGAFNRQKSAIAGQREELRSLQAQAASAAAVLAKLNSGDAIVGAGRDQSGRLAQIKTVSAEYERLTLQQGKLASSIATQENALGNSVSSLQRVGSTTNAVEAAIARARVELDAQTAALEKNTAAAQRNAAVGPRINDVTGVSRPAATTQGATFSALDARENEAAAAAARLRAELDPAAAAAAHLAAETAKVNALLASEHIDATEAAAAIKLLEANSNRLAKTPRISLFGLKPYETQNLMYQINDVFTGMASGQHMSQILAQQGGQILQLFPRVGSAVVGALSSAPVIAFVSAIGALVLGLHEAGEAAENLRKINAILTLNADGAQYQATALAAAEVSLKKFGLTAEEALAVVRVGIDKGFSQDRIVAFGQASENLSLILGVKVTDAANTLATALSGGYEAIQKFDAQTNIFTASQLELIKTLFEQGHAHEAVDMAAKIMFGTLEDGAGKARGPWADAIRSLGSAWESFLGWLGKTFIVKSMGEALDGLATNVDGFFRRINGALTHTEQLADALRKVREIQDEIAADARGETPPLRNWMAGGTPQDRLKAAQGEVARLQAPDPQVAAKTQAENTQRTAKANAEVADEIERQAVAAGKVTTEQKVQERVVQARKDALKDIQNRQPNASAAQQAAYADTVAERERVKAAAELTSYQEQQAAAAKRQANELERAARAANTMQARTIALLKTQEGYIGKAKWDRNAYRVGYGSDTTTAIDGSVSRVTSTTTTTEAAALRDLTRRVGEFADTVKRQIGSERYNAFNPQQQAALNSIAYNYGSLPDRILKAVRSGTAGEIAAAVRGLGGDNNGVNRGRRNREAALIETPNLELEQSSANIAKEHADAQQKLNEGLADENDKRRLGIASMRAQLGLVGEALIAEERRQAIAEAVLQKQQQVDKMNADRAARNLAPVEFTDAQRKEIVKTTGALYDLMHAQASATAQREAVERPVQDLSAQRDAVTQQIELAQASGKSTTGLEATYKSLTDQINAARDAQIALYESIIAGGDAPAAQNGTTVAALEAQVAAIKNAKAESTALGHQFLMTGKQINDSISGGVANAFDRFAQAVANGKNVFSSLLDSFLQFASEFLRQIALMIAEQAAFNAISGGQGGGTGSGGAGGGIAGFIGGLFHHEGGVVGVDGRVGAVNPAWYQNALRYHGGGIAGLRPDEVPAVLQRGEEVLTRSDPRHRANGDGGPGSRTKVVNVFDQEAMIREMLNTAAGEKAVLNVIQNNPTAVKSALG